MTTSHHSQKFDTEQLADTLVQTNTGWIEEGIIFNVLRKPDFWRMYCKGKINSYEDGVKYNDFSRPIHGLLYDLADQYYEAFPDAGALTETVVINLVNSEVLAGNCTPDDLAQAIDVAREAFDADLDKFAAWMNVVVPKWLVHRRVKQLTGPVPTSRDVNAKLLLQRLNRQVQKGSEGDREKIPNPMEYLERVKEGVEKPKEFYPIMSLGRFNNYLGGGLIPGEQGLIIIPSGGGKTVMANQMAGDLALTNKNVILVTTEQSYAEMYVRQYACHCNIPFKSVQRGLEMEKLSETERNMIHNYVQRVTPHLRVEDLTRNSANLETDLLSIFDRFEDEGFHPEVLIVDWLGCGLDHLDTGDKSAFMIRVMKSLQKQCEERHVASVIFAQGHPLKTKNVKFVQATDAAFCNLLHMYAHWGCGVSLLQEKVGDGEVGTDRMNARKTQFANFFKTRYDATGRLAMDREFAYQRWQVSDRLDDAD